MAKRRTKRVSNKRKASKKDLPSGRWIKAQVRRIGKRIQIKFRGHKK